MRRLAFVALAALLSTSTVAHAQVPPRNQKQKLEEALPHFQKGVELYDENDFSGALIEFKRAYDIAQDYHVLFNIAQTAYQVQNYAAALDAFQRYLDGAGSGIDRKRKSYVEGEIAKLKGRVAQVRVTVNVANADVLVDDEKVGTSPLDKPLVVSQGKRKITANVSGKPPVTKTIEIAGGDSTSVVLEVESEAPPPPPPPPPLAVETRRRIPWWSWGVTGGLAVVWGATGVTALVFSSQAQSKIATYGVTKNDITSAQDSARTFALVSDIALGCTVAMAGVATVLTILAKPEPVEKHEAKIIATPLGVFGTF